MRNSQTGCDPQRRWSPFAGRVSNSPANPLPAALHSAVGRLGQIVSKLLIYRIFSMLAGSSSGAEKRFLPEGREVRADRAACRRGTDFATAVRLPPVNSVRIPIAQPPRCQAGSK